MATSLFKPDVDDGVDWSAVADRLDPPPHPFATDPHGWVKDRLAEHVWSKEVEVLESLVDHRYTAVQSAHDVGKSYIASRAACWWLDVHPIGDAFVVSSAPTQTQVDAILWREIGRAHRKGNLPGRITGGMVPAWKVGPELVGFGRKPQDLKDEDAAMAAFQGIHALHVLVILDEGGGIPRWLYNAADTLVTNVNARLLVVGNPGDPHSHFAKVCGPGSGWHTIRIDGLESPNFTDEWVPDELRPLLLSPEWVAERKVRWGEDSPLYISKVRGQFPEVTENTLFPPALLEAAQALELPGTDKGQLGCDVAEEGEDKTTIYRNRGGQIRRVKVLTHASTTEVTGELVALMRPHNVPAHVDAIGVGSGVQNSLEEQGLDAHRFKASWSPIDKDRFESRKAEVYWTFREEMEEGKVDLPPDGEDDELIAELGAMRFFYTSKGQIRLETRKERQERGLPSPDHADGAVLSSIRAPAWALPSGAHGKTSRPAAPATATSGIRRDKF